MGFRIGDTAGPLAYRLQGEAGVSLTPASSMSVSDYIFNNPSCILRLTPNGTFATTSLASWPYNYPNGQSNALQGNMSRQFVSNLEWLYRTDFFYTPGIRDISFDQIDRADEIRAYRHPDAYPNRNRNRWLTYENNHEFLKIQIGSGEYNAPLKIVLYNEWDGEFLIRRENGEYVEALFSNSARKGFDEPGTIVNRYLGATSEINGKTWMHRAWEIYKSYFESAGLVGEIYGHYKDIERWDFQGVHPSYHVTTVQSTADSTHVVLATAPGQEVFIDPATGKADSLTWFDGDTGVHYAKKLVAYNDVTRECTLVSAATINPVVGGTCWLTGKFRTSEVDITRDGSNNTVAECDELNREGVRDGNNIMEEVWGDDLPAGYPRCGNAGGWRETRVGTPPRAPLDHVLRNFHDLPMSENWGTSRHGYVIEGDTQFRKQNNVGLYAIYESIKIAKTGMRPTEGEFSNPKWGRPMVAPECPFPMDTGVSPTDKLDITNWERGCEAACWLWAECMMEEQVIPNFRMADKNFTWSLDEVMIDLGDPVRTRDMIPNFNPGTDFQPPSGSIREADQGQNIYWEEFANAIVVVNLEPITTGELYEINTPQTVVDLPPPGVGKKWQRFDCNTYQNPSVPDLSTLGQMPAKNNGQDVTGGTYGQVSLARSTAICLLRVDGAQVIVNPIKVSAVNPLYFDQDGTTIYLTGLQTQRTIQPSFFGRQQDALIADSATWTDPNTGFLAWFVGNGMNFLREWVYWSTAWGRDGDNGICDVLPFARTGGPGAPDGGNKFDFDTFDATFFSRLDQMVSDCNDNNVVVAIVLFDVYGGFDENIAGQDHWGSPWRAEWNDEAIETDIGNVWSLGGMFDTPSTRVEEIQHAYVEKVIDTVNQYPNIIYEICNEQTNLPLTDVARWQKAMVTYINTYQDEKPNQHPVWISPGGRRDTGSYYNWEFVDAVQNNSDIFAVIQATKWGLGDFADEVPLNNFAGKPGIYDTDHVQKANLTGEGNPVQAYQLLWKSALRGYHYNEWEAYWYQEEPGAPSAFPYNVVNDLVTIQGYPGGFVNHRSNMKQVSHYCNSRFDNLALVTPTDDTAECSTGYCLRNAGEQYLVFSTPNTQFTITGLTNGAKYNYEWFNPANATVTSTGQTPAIAGGQQVFTPTYGDAVLFLEKEVVVAPTGLAANWPNVFSVWNNTKFEISYTHHYSSQYFRECMFCVRQGISKYNDNQRNGGTFPTTRDIVKGWYDGKQATIPVTQGHIVDHQAMNSVEWNEAGLSGQDGQLWRYIFTGNHFDESMRYDASGVGNPQRVVGKTGGASGFKSQVLPAGHASPGTITFFADMLAQCYADTWDGSSGLPWWEFKPGIAHDGIPDIAKKRLTYTRIPDLLVDSVPSTTETTLNGVWADVQLDGVDGGNGYQGVVVTPPTTGPWDLIIVAANKQDAWAARITGYKESGGKATILTSTFAHKGFEAPGDLAFIYNSKGDGHDFSDWDFPIDGVADPRYGTGRSKRLYAILSFFTQVDALTQAGGGYAYGPIGNLSESGFRKLSDGGNDQPNLYTNAFSYGHTENFNISIGFSSQDGFTATPNLAYALKKFPKNNAMLEQGYESLLIKHRADVTDLQITALGIRVHTRAFTYATSQDENWTAWYDKFDEVDASYMRFFLGYALSREKIMVEAAMSDISSNSEATGWVSEEYFLYMGGDPARSLGTYDPAGNSDFGSWTWRLPDFGDGGYVTWYDNFVVVINFGDGNTTMDPWIPSHLQGGQTLRNPEDYWTISGLPAGKKLVHPIFRGPNAYVNPVTEKKPHHNTFAGDLSTMQLGEDQTLNNGNNAGWNGLPSSTGMGVDGDTVPCATAEAVFLQIVDI